MAETAAPSNKPVEVEDFDMVATEGFELVKIDEGEYEAELTKLVKVPNVKVVRNNVESIVDMLRWQFTTPDGIEIGGTTSTKFSPKSHAHQWAGKLLGREIETGESLKPKALIGLQCRVIVKDKKRERMFNNQKQTDIYSVVTDVLAPKKKEEPPKEPPKESAKKGKTK